MGHTVLPTQVCAVITTFRPDDRLFACVEAILCQVGIVVIVDDSADTEVSEILAGRFKHERRIYLLCNDQNLGIAATLNVGVRLATELGFDWLLTIDDDSIAYPNAVGTLLSARATMPADIAIIGAGITMVSESTTDSPQAQSVAFEKRVVITSGMLLSTALYRAIGPFREEFFIDKVDTDYCLRVRAAGYRVVQLRQAGFAHRLGLPSTRVLFGRTITTHNYAPSRWYYQTRNLLVIIREHYRSEVAFCLVATAYHTRAICLMLLFECNRRAKLRAMAAGALHAFRHELCWRWSDNVDNVNHD